MGNDLNTKQYAHGISDDFDRVNQSELSNGMKPVVLDDKTIIYIGKNENKEKAKEKYLQQVQSNAVKSMVNMPSLRRERK